MECIESSLRHLQGAVGRFVGPSVSAIKAQIELRQRALRDMGVIPCRPYLEVGRKRNELD